MSTRNVYLTTLEGKVVVITGAASGIGRALALDAAGRGAVLALSDVDAPGLQQTADMIERQSSSADRRSVSTGSTQGAARPGPSRPPRIDKLDVRDRAAWKDYAAAVAADLGTVNVVINNAGVALSADVVDMDYESFDFVMDVDFWGVVQGTKEFLPYLIASGEGHVVNISSLFGILSIPGQSAYNAAKFGVRGFTEALRQEMVLAGHPVGVTCVHPGGIKTAIARNARAVGVDQAQHADFFDKKLARTSAEEAARVILDAMLAGKPRVLVGTDAKVLDKIVRLTGAGYQRLVTSVVRRSPLR